LKSKDKHPRHLELIFRLFIGKNLAIFPTKIFFKYPSIELLGFYINAFGLITTKNHIKAFRKLEFLCIFKVLKIYLKSFRFFQYLILYHAILLAPFQKQKIALFAIGRQKKIVNKNPKSIRRIT